MGASDEVCVQGSSSRAGFRLSGCQTWRELCSAVPAKLVDMADHFRALVSLLPSAFSFHVAQIVFGDYFVQVTFDHGLGSHTDAADTHRPSRRLPPEGRQRDLLPLVFGKGVR